VAVYALAQLRIQDRECKGGYMARFMDVFSNFPALLRFTRSPIRPSTLRSQATAKLAPTRSSC